MVSVCYPIIVVPRTLPTDFATAFRQSEQRGRVIGSNIWRAGLHANSRQEGGTVAS